MSIMHIPHLPVPRLADEDAVRLEAAAAEVRRAVDAYATVLADSEAATGRIAALPASEARALLSQVTGVLATVRAIVTGGAR